MTVASLRPSYQLQVCIRNHYAGKAHQSPMALEAEQDAVARSVIAFLHCSKLRKLDSMVQCKL